jgi:hypothetical protein
MPLGVTFRDTQVLDQRNVSIGIEIVEIIIVVSIVGVVDTR